MGAEAMAEAPAWWQFGVLSVQPGDVKKTAADIEAIRRDLGFEPSIPLVDGIAKIIERRFDCHKTRARLSI